mgnify:CR=1 FL=1
MQAGKQALAWNALGARSDASTPMSADGCTASAMQ